MIGHTAVRRQLEDDLPAAALLVGPTSIGKWTLTEHLADHHQVAAADRWAAPDGLHIDQVRTLKGFVMRAPYGPFKLIQARLDGSSIAALNALLKTLEEPPPTVRFLLTASRPTLPTIVSRCLVFRLGLLHRDELAAVLTRQGMSAGKAARVAALGHGQVAKALAVAAAEGPRAAVLNLIKALATGDRDLFERSFRTWDNTASDLLTAWLTEALTRRWALFSEDDAFGLHRDRTRLYDMAIAISRLPAARPRLGVRAALEPFAVRM